MVCTRTPLTALATGTGDQEPPLGCLGTGPWLMRQHGTHCVSSALPIPWQVSQEAVESPRNHPGSGSTGGGVRAAHLGHNAGFVHEEPAQP